MIFFFFLKAPFLFCEGSKWKFLLAVEHRLSSIQNIRYNLLFSGHFNQRLKTIQRSSLLAIPVLSGAKMPTVRGGKAMDKIKMGKVPDPIKNG